MKRFACLITVILATFGGNAHAWVGGPFDGGLHSSTLSRNSIFQAVLSFENGSGYVYFSPTQALTGDDINNTANVDGRAGIRNRSVLYYKGITYVGSAFGVNDDEARYVQGSLNATSELSFSSQTTNAQGQGANQTTTSSVSTTIVNSSRSFLVNGNFEAKVYQTSPSYRFRGEGQLAFISPNGTDAVAGLAFNAYSGLIDAIISAVANAAVGANFNPAVFTQAQIAINEALNDLPALLAGAGVDSTFDSAQKIKVKVSGTRRYL